ncbi:MAG: type I 3-dehydroquinate dehydratase [Candidatus Taylorbacteria bacterium]
MKEQKCRKFGIVASILVKSIMQLKEALKNTGWANSIEIRLDHIRPILTEEFEKIVAELKKPVILSMDPHPPGNDVWTETAMQDRWQSWSTIPKGLERLINQRSRDLFVDWDHGLTVFAAKHNRTQIFPWEKIGVSFHDWNGTPDEKRLRSQLFAMQTTQAKVFIKLVTTAKNENDLRTIEHLLKDKKDQWPMIAFAMGENGKQSRIECMYWGSAATYGYVPGFGPTAPGQLSIAELHDDPTVSRELPPAQ